MTTRPFRDPGFGDETLLRVLDRNLGTAARKAGDWLACRPGCTECCIGPFPITALDAARLRRGLAALAADDPERAEAVRRRAGHAVELLASSFPGDVRTGILADDEQRVDPYLERHVEMPCPVLDPATGHCDLYAHRPVSCRTVGPPVMLADDPLPPCRLCFCGAPAEEIERCRVNPDPRDLEDALLNALEDGHTEPLIAFVVRP